LIVQSRHFFGEKDMTIDVREAKDLVQVMESLLDSLDKTFDSLPSEIDQKVKDAKLTLLNLNINMKENDKFLRSLDKKTCDHSNARYFYLH
jgi:hypothetical protein